MKILAVFALGAVWASTEVQSSGYYSVLEAFLGAGGLTTSWKVASLTHTHDNVQKSIK